MGQYYTILLGGEASRRTWAAVRSPMFIGSGYRGTYPNNANWSTLNELQFGRPPIGGAGYPSGVSELTRAFPYQQSFTTFKQASVSFSLGCAWYYDSGNIVYKLRLGRSDYQDDPSGPDEITNLGYFFGTEPYIQGAYVGYDTHNARERYRGATVNVTINLAGGGSSTHTVTISDDLFPDELNMDFHGADGIFITSEPVGDPPLPPPSGFWWTINSVTLP